MMTALALLLLSFSSCATQPLAPASKEPAEIDSLTTEKQLWRAAHRVALNYPIHDLSEKERFIESDWIYEGRHSRYRFFVILNRSTPSEAVVEIQNQIRSSSRSQWRWSAPSLDKEEKLKQAIHAEFQESF